MKKILTLIGLLVLASMILSSCGPKPTTTTFTCGDAQYASTLTGSCDGEVARFEHNNKAISMIIWSDDLGQVNWMWDSDIACWHPSAVQLSNEGTTPREFWRNAEIICEWKKEQITITVDIAEMTPEPFQTEVITDPIETPLAPRCETTQVEPGDTETSDNWGFYATTVPPNKTIMVGAVKAQLQPGTYTFDLTGTVTWCQQPTDALDALLAGPGEPTALGNLVDLGFVVPAPIMIDLGDFSGATCTNTIGLAGWETYTSPYWAVYTTHLLADSSEVKVKLPPGSYRFRTFADVQYCSSEEAIAEVFTFITPGVEISLENLISWGYFEEVR